MTLPAPAPAPEPRSVPATAARTTGVIVPPEVACQCRGDCDRDADAAVPCRHCRLHIDPAYSPCPRLGFGCGMGAGDDTTPCECCTADQWKRARDGD